jgi:peroxiredoxin
MPDFTLPVYQGGALTLSSLRGKNVLILFAYV